MRNRIFFSTLTIILLGTFVLNSVSLSGQTGKEKPKASPIVTLTAANYDSEIKKGLVFVDFWAAWCGPCRRIAPILEEIAVEYKGQVKIGKLDVDNHKKFSIDKDVQALPTIVVYKDGKEMTRILGLVSKEKLVSVITAYSDQETVKVD